MMNPELHKRCRSLRFGAHIEIVVSEYERVALSVPALVEGARLEAKDLLATGKGGVEGKYTLDEHLAYLERAGAVRAGRPLLVLGARNNLVNLRAPVILNGRAHAVAGEDPELSRRPYYGIGLRAGRLVVDRALGGTDRSADWPEFFCAGIPALWDGLADPDLLELMLTEASDHSHLFYLPRGIHPDATPESRSAWQYLHDAFLAGLLADAATAGRSMGGALADIHPPLARSHDYLHAVLGVAEDGALVAVFAHGRLEEVGRLAARHGCRRAVCLENSGSIMPTYLPDGLAGERIPLLRAPNFRPRGRAALVLELPSAGFEVLPLGLAAAAARGGVG